MSIANGHNSPAQPERSTTLIGSGHASISGWPRLTLVDVIVLRSEWDIEVASTFVEHGQPVRVEVDFEQGPDGPEPKIELLHILLDRVQRRHSIEPRGYVPHPSVQWPYLRSCVVQPTPPRGHPDGVREPRRPKPGPSLGAATADVPLS